MSHPRFSVPEEQMTWRARAYLCVAASRHLAVGTIAAAVAGQYDDARWAVVISVLPLGVWAVVFGFGALHLAYAAAVAAEDHARTALVLSAGMTTAWAMGFLLAFTSSSSLLLGVLFAALAAKDLIVCAQPLRSPFEPVLRRLNPDDGKG